MSVRSWPTYLLNGIPPEVRAAIEEDAELDGVSLAEVMRGILCAHYGLNCETVDTFSKPPKPNRGTTTMVLRVHPELFAAIKEDAGQAGSSYGTAYGGMRKRIIEILSDFYSSRNGKETPA